MVSNTIETSVRFPVSTGAASASSAAAKKHTGMSVWTPQLATIAPNGAYGMAAAVRKDHRGARAFEDPV